MALSRPSPVTIPFANAGDKNVIPAADASPLASYDLGFPPVTSLPVESGGVPPEREDFNGILNAITTQLQWINAGGWPAYSSTMSSEISGYPKGAVLQSTDGAYSVVSLVDANTYAVTNRTYWAPWSGVLSQAGNYALDTSSHTGGSTNHYIIALTPPVTSNHAGIRACFKSIFTNTDTCTIDIGGGSTTLLRNDGAFLVAGDIVAGAIYEIVYDSNANAFQVISPVISQYAPLYAPEVPVGSILEYAGAVAPTGYFLCDGSLKDKTTYADLFNALGGESSPYGLDGSNFNLPDLRGRTPIGVGSGAGLTARVRGTNYGAETVTLDTTMIPAHTHSVAGVLVASGSTFSAAAGGAIVPTTGTVVSSSVGTGGAHANMQPSLAVNFIIKY